MYLKPEERNRRDLLRFWSKVKKRKGKRCWEWQGSRQEKRGGYGQFRTSKPRKYNRAHRWIYQQVFKVTLKPKELVCHKCDNPPCVRPSHLYLGTNKDNTSDKVSKGRHLASHCRRGHKYTKENTILWSNGYGIARRCRICTRECEKRELLRRKAIRARSK